MVSLCLAPKINAEVLGVMPCVSVEHIDLCMKSLLFFYFSYFFFGSAQYVLFHLKYFSSDTISLIFVTFDDFFFVLFL